MREWKEFNQWERIDDRYLPMMGEGETMATQAVTAVTKLVYRWFNDGDVYDNHYGVNGWCNDLSSYANWLWENVPQSQDALAMISKVGEESYSDLLYKLCEACFDEELLESLDKREKVGTIFTCEGRFYFEEWEEEDDEDWEW